MREREREREREHPPTRVKTLQRLDDSAELRGRVTLCFGERHLWRSLIHRGVGPDASGCFYTGTWGAVCVHGFKLCSQSDEKILRRMMQLWGKRYQPRRLRGRYFHVFSFRITAVRRDETEVFHIRCIIDFFFEDITCKQRWGEFAGILI